MASAGSRFGVPAELLIIITVKYLSTLPLTSVMLRRYVTEVCYGGSERPSRLGAKVTVVRASILKIATKQASFMGYSIQRHTLFQSYIPTLRSNCEDSVYSNYHLFNINMP